MIDYETNGSTRMTRGANRPCPPMSMGSSCSPGASCRRPRSASGSRGAATTPTPIDAAVARLLEERAIDDRRTAEAIARTETSVRRRGKLRVRRRIESAGIAGDRPAARWTRCSRTSIRTRSSRRRSRNGCAGATTIAGDAEFRRLYRYLIGQGFEADRVVRALKAIIAPRAPKARSVK